MRVTYGSLGWCVALKSGGTLSAAKQLVIDAPAKAGLGHIHIEERDVVLKVSSGGDILIERANPHRGPVKDDSMRDWCLAALPERIMVSMADDPTTEVQARELDIDCRMVADSRGFFVCRAEMILEGNTYHGGFQGVLQANHVLLRTLAVYDQVVKVPLITASTAVPRL